MEVWKIYQKAVSAFKARNLNAALNFLNQIKTLAPAYKKAYILEAYVWRERKNFVREFKALEKFLALVKPEDKELASNAFSLLAKTYNALAMPEESIKASALSTQTSTDDNDACEEIDNALLAANNLENFSVADFQALYDEYKKYLVDIVPYPKKFHEHSRIRVGFVSADFYLHPVINWAWALLTKLDKNSFEVHCYSNGKRHDEINKRLRASVDGWRDIYALADEETAKLIQGDEIDILFDLSGHTAGNRLRVAAYRPASVQISGVGYMNSTGLDCFDYFLTDVYCIGDSALYFTESFIVMPHSHVCYEPTTILEPAAEPPCLRNNFVTFACFNQFQKISDSLLNAWKKILDAVPASRLILKNQCS